MSFIDKIMEFFVNVVERDDCYTVEVIKGDSLWRIAEEITGDGKRWTEIAALNPGMDEKHTIHPGDELRIPKEWAAE